MLIGVKGSNGSYDDNVYVQSFGDNYHRHDMEPDSELEKACRKIRRRYKSYNDYIEAISLYNEYMEQVVEMNGGMRLFKLRLQSGEITCFIPHKPRLKSTLRNKMILKNKVVLSEVNFNNTDINDVLEYAEELRDYDVDTDSLVVTKGKGKEFKKIVNLVEPVSGNRMTSRGIKDISDLQFLEKYFLEEENKKNKGKKEKYTDRVTLNDILYDDVEGVTDANKDEVVFFKGRYMTRESVEEASVYEELNKLGYNSLKLMRTKSGNKNIAKVLKEEEKRTKKAKKKKKGRPKDMDSFMDVVIGDNYNSFEEFEKDILNMKSTDIFRY